MQTPATREAAILDWLAGFTSSSPTLAEASADASFRRYFRTVIDGETRIIMDAPPENEPSQGFIALATRLRDAGLRAPRVFAADLERGFVMLEDLGTTHYLSALRSGGDADTLYAAAIDAIVQMQVGLSPETLPDFVDTCLARELGLFTEWLLGRWLGRDLDTEAFQDGWQTLVTLLQRTLSEQPRVFVHRDFHSRNLMVPIDPTEDARPGILDFQDAVAGPLCYDLVSLLRDCYIEWPFARVTGWLSRFRAAIADAGRTDLPADPATWQRWFDLTATQRHLKAAGIFARLALRDGKHGYLQDIPRTLGYIEQAATRTPELAWIGALVSQQVQPAVASRLAGAAGRTTGHA